MKSRPILFSGPMVRAILEGRKTQTRRIVTPHKWEVGTIAWVRETFADTHLESQRKPWTYRADESEIDRDMYPLKWKPSIFMPREASRITLEITSVRVERLNEISEEDAIAEGTSFDAAIESIMCEPDRARRAYKLLWNSINGPGSWDKNPWVWVIKFKQILI